MCMCSIVFVNCASFCQTIFSPSWINQIKTLTEIRGSAVWNTTHLMFPLLRLDLDLWYVAPEKCWYSFISFLEWFSFVLLDFEGFRTLGFGHGLVNMCIVQLLSSATLNFWSDCLSIWTICNFAKIESESERDAVSKWCKTPLTKFGAGFLLL